MKANELMIGDWVMLDRNYPPSGVKKPVQLTLQDMIDIEQGKEYEPIDLTEAILNKNGWKHANDVCYLHAKGVAGVDVWMEWRKKNQTLFIGEGFIPVPVRNVHQIQLALHLCGLTKLADNFKLQED